MTKTDPKRLTKEIQGNADEKNPLTSFEVINEYVDQLKSFSEKKNYSKINPLWEKLRDKWGFLDFSEEDDDLRGNGYVTKDTRDSASEILMYAAALGKVRIAENLIKNHNADVNYRGVDKETPLLMALKRKRLKMVEYLLANGADIQGTHQGNNAKRIICTQGIALALPIFEKYGMDFMKPYVRTVRQNGLFSLHRIKIYPIVLAALTNQKKIVEILSQKKMPQNLIKELNIVLKKPKLFSQEIRDILEKALSKQYVGPFWERKKHQTGCLEK